MDWGALGEKIAAFGLTALGTAVGGPLGGLLGGTLSQALGLTDASPDEIADAMDANPTSAKMALRAIETEHQENLAWLNAQQAQAQQTGQTMRVEYGSADPYVRRWRPTWGYVSCAGWLIEALAIAVAIGGATWAALHGNAEAATALFGGATTLTYALAGLWSIALAVLGINIVQRSKDKQIAARDAPAPGILGAIAQRIAGTKETTQ